MATGFRVEIVIGDEGLEHSGKGVGENLIHACNNNPCQNQSNQTSMVPILTSAVFFGSQSKVFWYVFEVDACARVLWLLVVSFGKTRTLYVCQ
jgi:hypothetical protein